MHDAGEGEVRWAHLGQHCEVEQLSEGTFTVGIRVLTGPCALTQQGLLKDSENLAKHHECLLWC